MREYEEHPSQKPEALLERIILASSNPGDTVLDPFAGTFTSSAVAKKLGRRSIGVEIDAHYVGIGLRRLGLTKPGDDPYVPAVDKSGSYARRKRRRTAKR